MDEQADIGEHDPVTVCPEPLVSSASGPDGEAAYANEIVIAPDGTLRIKHLTPELLALALELAPDDPALRARAALLDARGTEAP
jgi:hypothetical protein